MGEQFVKVLQINSVCGIGSTGRIATDIHNVLIQEGHESYIAFGRDSNKNCTTTIKIGNKFDNYKHVALTRIYDKHAFGSKKATMDFITRIEEYNPDVIHLHNIHGYYINIELLFNYLKEANKPVVWTLHDCWAFTGHCSYFDYVSCNKWVTGCYKCPQKKSYPSSYIFDNSKDNFIKKKDIFTGVKNMTIVTPSKWLGGLVRQSFLNEYPVRVINNGIDLDVFKPTESNFRENYRINKKFIILGVASGWQKRKGYEYFIELSRELKEDEIIVMVGVTEKEKNNLPRNIIGITKTNSTIELAEIYTASDVFINPTLEDNFPTTNLEALACGMPVVTFNTGGSIESIDEGSGFIVEKGNLNELRKQIDIIKQNGKATYTQNSILLAFNRYNKQDRFYDYINLYYSILNYNS
jgi:putative colanic acid biosynthesis glycosyltransferase